MPFLTYDEYTALGYSKIDKADFPRLERQAERYIKTRAAAYGGSRLGAGFDDELKEATALVVEQIQSDETNSIGSGEHGAVTSESIGKVSKSYATLDAETAAKLSDNSKYSILKDYLGATGWLSRAVSALNKGKCRYWCNPPVKPPTDGDGGEEDMASKHCDVYYLLGSFQGGFDEFGNTLTFPGGPVRWDCAAGSGEVTVAPGTLTYSHGSWILFDITQGENAEVKTGPWPTEDDVYVCGYMHNNGPKKIIEIFGMGTQVWEA